MDPDKVSLENLTKSFEYVRMANEIDNYTDIDEIKNIAKCFCKLYYKQQETLSAIGIQDAK